MLFKAVALPLSVRSRLQARSYRGGAVPVLEWQQRELGSLRAPVWVRRRSGREAGPEVPRWAARGEERAGSRGVQLPSPPEWDVLVWVSQADVFLKLQERSHTTAGTHSCSSVMLLSSPDCILITLILNSLDFLFNAAKNLGMTYFFWQVSASSRTGYLPPIPLF